MDNKQTGSAMGRVMAQMDGEDTQGTVATIKIGESKSKEPHNPHRVVDMRDDALKFVLDNMEYLQKLVDTVKPHPIPDNETEELITPSGEEAENLLMDFLRRHELPTCCRFYFKLVACGNNEQTIFVVANDVQATFVNAYISKIQHHFNKEWADPEEYLLSTVSKIRKRARALYNIQYIYPSKYDHDVHHIPICCNTGHTRMYHYINSCGGTNAKDFLSTEYVDGVTMYKTPSIINTMEQSLSGGNSIIIGFPEFVKNLSKDIDDFRSLCKQMTLGDIINNWKSYWLIRFFMDTYEDNFKHFAIQSEDEESPNTKD